MFSSTTTAPFIYNAPKTKKEIVTRLFKEGHIDLDEVMELMNTPTLPTTPSVKYPWEQPWWETLNIPCDTYRQTSYKINCESKEGL